MNNTTSNINQLNSKVYEYEQRIKYLESRISELENEVFMLQSSGRRQIRKPLNNKSELLLILNELKSKKKKTVKDKENIDILEVILRTSR
jgi:hypothetical protein